MTDFTPPEIGEYRLLDQSRRTRAMRWVMAIMLFLTVLAGALGLGMFGATARLDRQLAGQLTVQIVNPDPAARDRQAQALVRMLGAMPAIRRAREADRAQLAELLKPWLGDAGLDPDLPMPAIVDVELHSIAAMPAVEAAVQKAAPGARVDRNARWLTPVRGLLLTLIWVALGLMLVIAVATGGVVLLAARAGLDMHRNTIEVLHMLGSTDVQVARLFQRRIAIDTLSGGLAGTCAGLALVWLLQSRLAMLGSEVLAGAAPRPFDWLLLTLLPFLFALMATLAARIAVLRALGRQL